VQGAGSGTNFISVGSATANLDGINGPINIIGLAGAENDLSIIDSASITSYQFVIDRDFVQRGGRARIGYQNMSQLTVRTAAQPDHIIVQDTAPFAIGPQHVDRRRRQRCDRRRQDDRDPAHRRGRLQRDHRRQRHQFAGQHPRRDRRDSVRGQPRHLEPQRPGGNDDAAAGRCHEFLWFPRFQRSGAAVINVLSSSLAAFNWFGGSGGNTVNVKKLPAPASTFTLGSGGDVVNLGTTANQLFNTGTMHIVGGAGADQLLLRDDGTTTPQRYDVGNFQSSAEKHSE